MKENKLLISSDSPWEDVVGYSRAVKVGNLIEVSGTTAVDGEKVMGKGDVYINKLSLFFKKLKRY
jgi:enamine deaminase RidA (YjgF/YER057c/UK114 family)